MILKNLTRAKIKLAIAINFVYSKETDKGLVMHLQNDNIEKKMINDITKCFNHFFVDIKLGWKH